VTHQGLEP